MEESLGRRETRPFKTAALVLIFLLYFYRLSGTGLLGPDEPRYAAIGRQMAFSGDWITPRLWGDPWFEKPPLLYWMTAFGFHLSLDEDLAPRVPVAALSVLFLGFFFWLLRREFDQRTAIIATAILGTCGGWLAYSYVAAPDLPMSAFFAAAMLLGMVWMRSGEQSFLIAAAASLGLATLAKGLVPLALAIPFAWSVRRKWRELLNPAAVLTFLVVALPWYCLCYLRNGSVFWQKIFWEHQVGRYISPALLHGQPVWFYIPYFAAAVFPWTPLLAVLFRRSLYSDERRKLLLLWLVFGLIFFSLSSNKLPGYILPLLPAAAALMGVALAEGAGHWLLCACAAMLCLIGPVASILPQMLVSGLFKSQIAPWTITWLIPVALVPLVWFLPRVWAVVVIVVGVTTGVVFVKTQTFPSIDAVASARHLRAQVEKMGAVNVCLDDIPRNLRYGLNYYTVTPLPDCAQHPRPVRLRVWGH